MRVITGRVVDGRIEVKGDLQEGAAVAILAADEGGFQLNAEEEEELVAALEEIRRGNYVDGRELLRELKSSGPR
ncbi:MAG TPA: hypothetical protein VGQ36_22935 [Thermoanaerobaculia bacterium]|jgi:hypothetical protein|nr:hypothetical protein [Thermoanaerobaculia bacterium]